MTTVRDLLPGNVMEMSGNTATVIVTTPHPFYRGGSLALVVWWLHDEQRFSFDALSWHQVLPGRIVTGPFGVVPQDQLDRAWQAAMKEGNV